MGQGREGCDGEQQGLDWGRRGPQSPLRGLGENRKMSGGIHHFLPSVINTRWRGRRQESGHRHSMIPWGRLMDPSALADHLQVPWGGR